jgi:hypothetical protein
MRWKEAKRGLFLASLMGAMWLLGSPSASSADQGKWWNPERGGGNHGRGEYRGGGASYRAPAWHGSGSGSVTWHGSGSSGRVTYNSGPRYYRPWRGRTVYRDYVHVRLGPSYQYRPVSGWRYYCPPSYYYPQHIVYVRPVRFFISASAVIGGVGISGTYADPGEIYGCNFCDARFDDYDDYAAHVQHCPYGPHGYRVEARAWDQDQWSDRDWQDDRNWDREDEDRDYDYDR